MKGPPLPRIRFATLPEALASAATGDDGLTFLGLDEKGREVPWREVHARSRRAARALQERGVVPGSRVAIVLPTSPLFADAFFGTLLAGAIPVPLYPPLRLGRLDEYERTTAALLEGAGACLVISDPRTALLLGVPLARARPRLGSLNAEALTREEGEPLRIDVGPEALALIQYSSGSTLHPKPIALSHRALLAQCAALEALVTAPEHGRDVGVSWLPLYHDMGLIGCLLMAMYRPGPLVLIPPEHFLARPALWLRAISRFRATVSPAPNFAYGLCLKRVTDAELEGVDLSCWRFALNGAEPVSAELLRRFGERFQRFGLDPSSLIPVYGLAEASLAVTFSARGPLRTCRLDAERLAAEGRVAAGPRETCAVGGPIPGVELEVRDESGRALPDGHAGIVFVRSPSLMRGYFGDEEATRQVLRDGWLDTGDVGFVMDGGLHVTGRAKEVVIVRGANHSPREFEECVESLEGVRAGCVVAAGFVPDGGSEELLVLAERAAGLPDAELENRIRAAVVEKTGLRPHTVRVLEPGTLPRTSSGKLRRSEALRRFLANELAPPMRVGLSRLAWSMGRSTLARARARLGRPSLELATRTGGDDPVPPAGGGDGA